MIACGSDEVDMADWKNQSAPNVTIKFIKMRLRNHISIQGENLPKCTVDNSSS